MTAGGARWVTASLSPAAIAEHVAAIQCGLDATRWRADRAAARKWSCRDLLKRQPADDVLPFDAQRAHALYKGIFGGIESAMAGKKIYVVASGPLADMPLGVLVRQRPAQSPVTAHAALRGLDWFGLASPLAILPSVAALRSLRGDRKTAAAPEAFIGFGDPVLTGDSRCEASNVPMSCPQIASAADPAQPRATRRSARIYADVAKRALQNGAADVAAVRRLCPLPETAQELRCVAQSLGADASRIVVGPQMTETALKRLPLERYRIVHFATHGLLAGETSEVSGGLAAPALVLTPPQTGSAIDDGLLTASEVAALKLNADWVVLSACNTASGGGSSGETLSGLTRAFFYAGARAVLASHWAVNSDAAVKLTTGAFAELRGNPAIGRAEALRRTMSAMVRNGLPHESHPSHWAPFVLVGDGAEALR